MRAVPLLEVVPLHRVIPAAGTTETHILLRVRAPDVTPGEGPRVQTVLVLDSSGSMSGDPMAHVIDSSRRIVDILHDDDALGVVAFASTARTVSPLRTLRAEARHDCKRELLSLAAGGSTFLSGAVEHAADLLPPAPDGVRQLLLVLSDGHPNVGLRTPPEFAALGGRLRARDLSVSTLGFGANHNDAVMVALADAAGGRYAFVASPALAGSSFARCLGAVRDKVCAGLSLHLRLVPGAEVVRVLGDAQVTVTAAGLRVALSDLVLGDTLDVVVKVTLTPGGHRGEWAPLSATLEGRDARTQEPFHVTDEAVVLSAAEGAAGPADPEVLGLVMATGAEEARARARLVADRGDYTGAGRVIAEAMGRFEALPGFVRGAAGLLGEAYEALVDDRDTYARVRDVGEYSRFKKASMDYSAIVQTGGRRYGLGTLAMSSPSSSQMLYAMQGDIPPAVLVDESGREIVVGAECELGRAPDNRIVLPDPRVSRRHARIVYVQGVFYVVDLGSSAGTRVNGELVHDQRALRHNDTLDLGGHLLRFALR
jgi:uncharacterized protein YegL